MSFINVAFLQDVRKKAQAIQKQNTAPHMLSRGGYEYLEKKLMEEKRKKKLEEAAQFGSTDTVINPPSRRLPHPPRAADPVREPNNLSPPGRRRLSTWYTAHCPGIAHRETDSW